MSYLRMGLLVVFAVAVVGCVPRMYRADEPMSALGCEKLKLAITAKQLCAQMRNCTFTPADIESGLVQVENYRLHCAPMK